ncbi:MAG: beta-lactamase family protein [Eubacterium sp.]|nr:beta-lactamase family protein [Eubacterium sp.]
MKINRYKYTFATLLILGAVSIGAGISPVQAKSDVSDKNVVLNTNNIENDVVEVDEAEDIKRDNPYDERVYCVGSVSKTYVTTCVMQLVDQGMVELDTPVTEYIPEFTMADERYKDITVRMLMNHTSGIMGSTYSNEELYEDYYDNYKEAVLAKLSGQVLKAAPGEYSAYCNDGFTLLEIIVENVSGMSFTDYMDENISKKLDLQHTGTPVNMMRDPLDVEIYIYGNTLYDNEYCNAIGSGGVKATASEVARFGSTFFAGDNTLLTEASKKEMSTRWNEAGDNTNIHQDCNGLGWDMAEYISCENRDVKVVGKGGDLSNQHAYLMVAPDEKISVSVLSSGGDSTKNELLCQELMKIVLEDRGINVETTTEDEIVFEDTVPEEYKKYEGYYYMLTMDGLEVVYISFEEDSLCMDHIYRDTDEKTLFKYADGGFIKIDKDGNVSLDKEILWFEEKNGNTYIKADASTDYYGLGTENMSIYAAEKLDENKVSEDVLSDWMQMNEKTFVLYSDVYSSESYESPFMGLSMNEEIPGYVRFAEPGALGSTLKINSNTEARFFTGIESSANRDLDNIQIMKDTKKDGTEMTIVNSDTFGKYCMIDELPVFDSNVDEVKLVTNEASWYKISDDIAGKSLTIERPENSNIYVYNQFYEVVYSTHMKNASDNIPLPEGGYIVFLGETGDTVTLQ